MVSSAAHLSLYAGTRYQRLDFHLWSIAMPASIHVSQYNACQCMLMAPAHQLPMHVGRTRLDRQLLDAVHEGLTWHYSDIFMSPFGLQQNQSQGCNRPLACALTVLSPLPDFPMLCNVAHHAAPSWPLGFCLSNYPTPTENMVHSVHLQADPARCRHLYDVILSASHAACNGSRW